MKLTSKQVNQLRRNLAVWPRPSKRHGVGLFAMRTFHAGDTILVLPRGGPGELLLGRNELRRFGDLAGFMTERFPIDGWHQPKLVMRRWWLAGDSIPLGDIMYLFLNSDPNPNAGVIWRRDREELIALKAITTADEICVDYDLQACSLASLAP
jgi:hypothetical protein